MFYRPYYRAIIYCLTNKSRAVRHHAELTTKRLLSLLGGTSISLALIEECGEMLSTQKVCSNAQEQLLLA